MFPRKQKLALARRVLRAPDAHFKRKVLIEFVELLRESLTITIALAPQTMAMFVKDKEKEHFGVAKCGAKRIVLVPRKKVRSKVMKQSRTHHMPHYQMHQYEVRFTLPSDIVKNWQGNGGGGFAVVLSSNGRRVKSDGNSNRWKKSERMMKWEQQCQKIRVAKAQSDIDALD